MTIYRAQILECGSNKIIHMSNCKDMPEAMNFCDWHFERITGEKPKYKTLSSLKSAKAKDLDSLNTYVFCKVEIIIKKIGE